MPDDRSDYDNTQDIIRALLEERRGYEIHGNTDSLKAVDAELKRLGAQAKPPAKRAAKRTKSG